MEKTMRLTDEEAMQLTIKGFLTQNDDLPVPTLQGVRNAASSAVDAFQDEFNASLFFDTLDRVVKRLKTDYDNRKGIV